MVELCNSTKGVCLTGKLAAWLTGPSFPLLNCGDFLGRHQHQTLLIRFLGLPKRQKACITPAHLARQVLKVHPLYKPQCLTKSHPLMFESGLVSMGRERAETCLWSLKDELSRGSKRELLSVCISQSATLPLSFCSILVQTQQYLLTK